MGPLRRYGDDMTEVVPLSAVAPPDGLHAVEARVLAAACTLAARGHEVDVFEKNEWRWAGDTATDANHYSKRALLWGVLASTLAVRLARGETAAERHLDARLADVMRIETWKAKLPPVMDGLTVLAAQLGRLRYAARTARA